VLDRGGQLFHFAESGIGRGDVRAEWLDVNVHLRRSIAQLADAFLELSGLAMSVAQAEIFVDFQVQLDKKPAALLQRG